MPQIIRCLHDELVPLAALKPHPQNRNRHSPEQIKRLAKIIEYQGVRRPIQVSKRSGFMVVGHGLLAAMRLGGWTRAPVNYQEFESEEQEYAHLQADNGIALWAELDLSAINADLENLGPDFDIDMLGLQNFTLDMSEKDEDRASLADRFLVPPFSVLDARQGYWQDRKRYWLALGIQSELGRGGAANDQQGNDHGESKLLPQSKTLGAVPPNQMAILKRTGKYA